MCDAVEITSAEVLSQFAKVRYGKYKGTVTPHKQLLLIFVLAKYHGESDRLIPYAAIDYALTKIAKRYFPEIKAFHANYPFWRLQNDNIWEVTNQERLSNQCRKSDLSRSEFIKNDIYGGFTHPIYRAIISDNSLFDALIRMVSANLPPEKQSCILTDMGFDQLSGYTEHRVSQEFLEIFTQETVEDFITLS